MVDITFKIDESKINERFEQWLFENKIIHDVVELDESQYLDVVDVFSKSLSINEYSWIDSLDEANDKFIELIKKTPNKELIENADIIPEE